MSKIYLDAVFEFDGQKWRLIYAEAFPPVDPEDSEAAMEDNRRTTQEWFLEDLHNSDPEYEFDLPQPSWREYLWYQTILQGRFYPAGTRVFYFGLVCVGDWSNTPEGREYDQHWEWDRQVIVEPPNAKAIRRREGLRAARTLLASGGRCTDCRTSIIDPRPDSEGQRRKMCPRCAERKVIHEQAVAADPLYDMRRTAFGEWNRATDGGSQQQKWERILAMDRPELLRCIDEWRRQADEALRMWQAYQ